MPEAPRRSNEAHGAVPMGPTRRRGCARRLGVRRTVMSGAPRAEPHGPLQRLLEFAFIEATVRARNAARKLNP